MKAQPVQDRDQAVPVSVRIEHDLWLLVKAEARRFHVSIGKRLSDLIEEALPVKRDLYWQNGYAYSPPMISGEPPTRTVKMQRPVEPLAKQLLDEECERVGRYFGRKRVAASVVLEHIIRTFCSVSNSNTGSAGRLGKSRRERPKQSRGLEASAWRYWPFLTPEFRIWVSPTTWVTAG